MSLKNMMEKNKKTTTIQKLADYIKNTADKSYYALTIDNLINNFKKIRIIEFADSKSGKKSRRIFLTKENVDIFRVLVDMIIGEPLTLEQLYADDCDECGSVDIYNYFEEKFGETQIKNSDADNKDKVKILFEKLVRGRYVLDEYLKIRGNLGNDTRDIVNTDFFGDLIDEFFPAEIEGGSRVYYDHSFRDHKTMLLGSYTFRSPEVIKQIEERYNDDKENIGELYKLIQVLKDKEITNLDIFNRIATKFKEGDFNDIIQSSIALMKTHLLDLAKYKNTELINYYIRYPDQFDIYSLPTNSMKTDGPNLLVLLTKLYIPDNFTESVYLTDRNIRENRNRSIQDLREMGLVNDNYLNYPLIIYNTRGIYNEIKRKIKRRRPRLKIPKFNNDFNFKLLDLLKDRLVLNKIDVPRFIDWFLSEYARNHNNIRIRPYLIKKVEDKGMYDTNIFTYLCIWIKQKLISDKILEEHLTIFIDTKINTLLEKLRLSDKIKTNLQSNITTTKNNLNAKLFNEMETFNEALANNLSKDFISKFKKDIKEEISTGEELIKIIENKLNDFNDIKEQFEQCVNLFNQIKDAITTFKYKNKIPALKNAIKVNKKKVIKELGIIVELIKYDLPQLNKIIKAYIKEFNNKKDTIIKKFKKVNNKDKLEKRFDNIKREFDNIKREFETKNINISDKGYEFFEKILLWKKFRDRFTQKKNELLNHNIETKSNESKCVQYQKLTFFVNANYMSLNNITYEDFDNNKKYLNGIVGDNYKFIKIKYNRNHFIVYDTSENIEGFYKPVYYNRMKTTKIQYILKNNNKEIRDNQYIINTNLFFYYWLEIFSKEDFYHYTYLLGRKIICLNILRDFNTEIPVEEAQNYLLDYIEWKKKGLSYSERKYDIKIKKNERNKKNKAKRKRNKFKYEFKFINI